MLQKIKAFKRVNINNSI